MAKVLENKAGTGVVCDVLEYAVADMKKGERAVTSQAAECSVERSG